jgi:nitroimidazol reductase NimA-like FMN-containing flavoprotein (pyridoxamine 5'-phosphate oxidase superfamily)
MTRIDQPLNKIRRSNHAKDDDWIQAFLTRGAMGTMATCIDDQPFQVTRNYAYDASREAIYMHGARKGRTFENIQENSKICFSVSEMGRLLPADEALEVGIEYAGVVVFGQAQIVDDEAEATYGLQLLLDKYFPHLKPGKDYTPITPKALKTTAVLRIDIESWSGKAVEVEDDYPGAFYFNALSQKSEPAGTHTIPDEES